jgi:hypothetical protein
MAIAAIATAALAADTAGMVSYKNRSTALAYAWLVKGPDAVAPGATIRRLVLSATDIGAKLRACKAMSCTDGSVSEGMTVDLGAGPRLNYWIAQNAQRIQYSGTARPEAMSIRIDDATRLAGRLAIDDTTAGGPKFAVDFDAPMTMEFKAAH